MYEMWSAVAPVDISAPAPSARSKHSATLVGEYVYLLGGRNGNLPTKDFWKYSLVTGKWHQLHPNGDKLPSLQEHSAVSYKDNIYVFGGEVGFSAGTETPLWSYDIKNNNWRKIKSKKGVSTPKGRRGHSALIHRGSMLIYGGYQDLRGSSSELWAYHFETESWHLLCNSRGDLYPPPRHKHSAILYDESMWIYGGMTDLQERSDLWKWDIDTKTWINIKTKINPGALHSHAACKLGSSMVIFGGERTGHLTNDLWKFNFGTELWEKLSISGSKPQPRSETILFPVSSECFQSLDYRSVRIRSRTCISADRGSRHSSYLPNNKVAPCEKTYVFEPSQTNYTDGSTDLSSEINGKTSRSFLQEITKLSQFPKLNNMCSYTVLSGCNTDSTESLLKQHASPQDQEICTSPSKGVMVKSKSAYVIKKSHIDVEDQKKKVEFDDKVKKITREPISVPNFSTLVLPTPVLTPVEATKLVYLDTDDENDLENDLPTAKTNNNNNNKSNLANGESGEMLNTVKRGESYSSHLGYADNPLYQHMVNSSSVKFANSERHQDENVSSTSDYASIETVNRLSSASNYSVKTNTPQEENVNTKCNNDKEIRDKDGPFGFCNPNYLEQSIEKKNVANLLTQQTDRDAIKKSEEDLLELQNYNGIISKNTKVYYRHSSRTTRPPKSLDIADNRSRDNKNRALSASRVERKRSNVHQIESELIDKVDAHIAINLYIIGGKEQGQVTVFQRPISMWKLKLY